MFLIPTYLDASPIHGVGVFSPGFIKQGTIIWKYSPATDWRMTPEELASFPEPFRTRLRSYSYKDDDGMYVLCGDNAKFMNHSEAPNCDDTSERFTITLRDIAPNEELTCDYRTFDSESREIGVLYQATHVNGA